MLIEIYEDACKMCRGSGIFECDFPENGRDDYINIIDSSSCICPLCGGDGQARFSRNEVTNVIIGILEYTLNASAGITSVRCNKCKSYPSITVIEDEDNNEILFMIGCKCYSTTQHDDIKSAISEYEEHLKDV